MTPEEKIQAELTGQFSFLEQSIKIARPRRIFIDLSYDKFDQVFSYLAKKMDFTFLGTIIGSDEGERFSVIYHLVSGGNIVLNLKTFVPKENPVLKSVMPMFVNAEVYEREMVDLLGIDVQGLPEGNRYPLTDDWPKDEHPLRKDWKPSNSQKEGAV